MHVFINGKVAESGGPELADRLENEGYDRYSRCGLIDAYRTVEHELNVLHEGTRRPGCGELARIRADFPI